MAKRLCMVLALFYLTWMTGCSKNSRRIVFLNSFHSGFASGDSVAAGIQKTLSTDTDVQLKTFFLNSKKKPPESFTKKDNDWWIKTIQKCKPDVIIAYGDPVVKSIISPNFRKGAIPVVFCGVGWSCAPYGLPTETVTGMLERLPVAGIIQAFKKDFPEIHCITVIAENSTAERKNSKYFDSLLRQMGITGDFELVDTFSGWKNAFIKANAQADLVYLLNTVTLPDWNDNQAREFVFRYIHRPIATSDLSMMPFAVIGLTLVDREQGEWAAKTAMQILSGTPTTDIPITIYESYKRCINPLLANRIRYRPASGFLKDAFSVESKTF